MNTSIYHFTSRGSFTLMHKGHPNRQDIAEVEKFAKEILKDFES